MQDEELLGTIVKAADMLDKSGRHDLSSRLDGILEKVAAKKGKTKEGWPKKLKTGRFTSWCKRNGFDGPSVAAANKAMKSDDASVRGMASFYLNTTVKKKKGK